MFSTFTTLLIHEKTAFFKLHKRLCVIAIAALYICSDDFCHTKACGLRCHLPLLAPVLTNTSHLKWLRTRSTFFMK